MKYFFLYIKILVANIIKSLSEIRNQARLALKYPNCKLHNRVSLVNSSLEGFNVLFNQVYILNSNLGRHTYVQRNSTILHANVGRYCSIASNVSIGPGIHKIDGVSTHPAFYLKDTPLVKTYCKKDLFTPFANTVIENDVWIGESAIIVDGVIIGNGAIVAAGAIVTKDVPPYAIVAGVPAKVIKYRFSADVISSLLKSEWWNWPEVEIENKASNFLNVQNFSLS